MTRKEFEQFLQAPPYEKNVTRWVAEDDAHYGWPGQYQSYEVQLAWEVLVEAMKRMVERT